MDCFLKEVGAAPEKILGVGISIPGVIDQSRELFFQRLESGDEVIREAWNFYLKYLALAVTNLRMAFDCDIVLGGYIGQYLKPYMVFRIIFLYTQIAFAAKLRYTEKRRLIEYTLPQPFYYDQSEGMACHGGPL